VNPGDYYLFDTQKNELKYLASSRKWVDPAQMSAMEPIEYKSRDGLTIHGYLTVPKGKDKKNLPLVVLPHQGPHDERNVWEFDPQVQLLASRGIAVLQVNYRGSSGYGSEFEEAGYRHWGGAVQHDIIDGVNFLFDQGIADKKRVCILGASFGGYSALQSAILEPDMFQCAVGVMGMYDLPKMFEAGELSESDAGLSYLKKVLGDEPAKLSAISPSYNVDKLKVPVFIVHGGEDKKAPIEQAESLVNALKKKGKDYSYYVLENEGHGFYTATSRAQYYEKVLAFLSQHLKL
jgi:dipeptidyl aminopeptidase/acylaminoacyl peptidase